ncbi:MAG TPA: ABC transporter permease [Candidatus Paceibacterota bacterium]|nr:ABC transporter permease [Candidatus Paceibacterota bacterium]
MRVSDLVRSSRATLKHGKMRSLLTMLGIVIGISSVIILMSIGASAQDYILNQVQGLGSNLIIVIPGGTNNGKFSSPASAQGIVVTSLVQQDVDALSRDPSVAAVTEENRGQATASFQDNSEVTTFDGVPANFFTVRNFTVAEGYPFTDSDVQAYNHVAVIGPSLAATLFGAGSDPVGEYIQVKNIQFRIVGVLASSGTGAFGVDQDDLVMVPITVAQTQMLGINYFNDIMVEANSSYNISFAQQRVQTILEQDHGITDPDKDDFTIETQQSVLSLLGNITNILTLFLAAIASISLVVGGIGIMNIMLVSVIERTKEIGLRKSVGATNRDILQQFLVESAMLTVVGGVIGIALGGVVVGAAWLVITKGFGVAWTFEFPLSAILLAVIVSSVTGIAFGIYPASQAARKSPIEALRYE